MAGRRERLAIGADTRRDLGGGLVADGDEDRQALPADGYKRIGTGGGDTDRRRRLLVWLGDHRDVLEPMELALIRHRLLRPCLLHDVEHLREPLAAFAIGHAIRLVGARHTAAPDAEDQPPVADLIDGRRLLGQAQRMAQRQHLHGEPDLHPLRARRDGARDAQRRREHRTRGVEVQLAQPHRIEAPAFGSHPPVRRIARTPRRASVPAGTGTHGRCRTPLLPPFGFLI